mmetsp:Transcript_28769/g.51453  ORF Transcript_28769/g.51453 Transcript_28769/m.51453 type:complete len:128 (+) Transcript_28769:2515-2898(+)
MLRNRSGRISPRVEGIAWRWLSRSQDYFCIIPLYPVSDVALKITTDRQLCPEPVREVELIGAYFLDLHYTLMHDEPLMLVRARNDLLPLAVLLIDRVICSLQQSVTREKLGRESPPAWSHHLTEKSC